MKKTLKSLLCLLLIIVAILSLTACGNSKLTMENYNKITCGTLNYNTYQYEGGMTLEQVKNILGEPTESASSTVMGVTSTAYVWGNENKNITVSFYKSIFHHAKRKAKCLPFCVVELTRFELVTF